jgi:hypothetical protein
MNDEVTHPKEGFHQGGFSGGRCPYCSSGEIVTGLEFNLNAEVGPFGLPYRAIGPFRGTERLYADLCTACGTVLRIYVKETKRKWIQRGEKNKGL